MADTTGEALANRILALNESLPELERFNLNLLMSVAMGGLSPRSGPPAEGVRKEAWEAGLRVLSGMAKSGLGFQGRAEFMTDELLGQLQAEAREQERISHRTGPQELAPGGPVAVALSSDPVVLDFVGGVVGTKVYPTEIGSYLYYNQADDHLYPHVDTDVFSVNLITMLEHQVPDGTAIEDASALVVYEPEREPVRVPLAVGESAVLFASGTVHGRESIRPGERVTILTVGFQYTGLKGGR